MQICIYKICKELWVSDNFLLCCFFGGGCSLLLLGFFVFLAFFACFFVSFGFGRLLLLGGFFLFCFGLFFCFVFEIQHFLVISNTPKALLLQVGTMYHLAVQFIIQTHYHTHYCELWKFPGWSSLTIWHLSTDLCLYIKSILWKHLNIHW